MAKSKDSKRTAEDTIKEVAAGCARWLRGDTAPCLLSPSQETPDPETLMIRQWLIALNEAGFATDFSQPGFTVRRGCGQRAAVSGFCSDRAGCSIAALSLATDLIICAYPPGYEGGYMFPITIEDYHPFSWSGRFSFTDCLDQLDRPVSRAIQNALIRSWYVVAIDPKWGRKEHLWRHLLRAVGPGAKPFDVTPAAGLALDTDFLC